MMKRFYFILLLALINGLFISGCKKPLLDFDVNVSSINARRQGDTLSIRIKSNTNWTVTSNADWCIPSFTTANKIKTLKLFVEPNRTGVNRSSKIKVEVNPELSEEINVSQLGVMTILIGGVNGIQYSMDLCHSWSTPLSASGINDLYKNGKNIFAASGTIFYKSNDYGISWSEVPKLYGKGVSTITSVENVMITGTTGNGIYKSTDDCANWTNIKLSLSDNSKNFVNEICCCNSALYAATENGIMRSSDYGSSWQFCTGTDGAIKYICGEGSNIFAVNMVSSTNYKVFHSANSGSSWNYDFNLYVPIKGIKVYNDSVYCMFDYLLGGSYLYGCKISNPSVWTAFYYTDEYDMLYSSDEAFGIVKSTQLLYKTIDNNNWKTVNLISVPNSLLLY